MNTTSQIIRSRRTIKPSHFNGKLIPDAQVEALLELADWAPTHKFTEPWRFVVYAPERVKGFCLEHAALYRAHTPADAYEQAKFDKLLNLGNKTSHIVMVYMRRTAGTKLPEWEEVAAVACATQNLLLGAHDLGIAAFWSTGGMTNHPAMKPWLGLEETDKPMGILYLGYADEQVAGVRRIPLAEKIRWER